MSAHSPRLQFVTGLPDSPKTEAKGVVLVKGPWYETPGSPRLPFDLNQSFVFLGLSQVCWNFVRPQVICFLTLPISLNFLWVSTGEAS